MVRNIFSICELSILQKSSILFVGKVKITPFNGSISCNGSRPFLCGTGVCPLYHHYFFNRMSTTYCTVVLIYYHYLCCVASCYKYCFFFLFFGALHTHLSWFCPLCCCIVSATASLSPSVPEQLLPTQKCQQHQMHLPRNRHMINMYRRV